MSNDTASKIFYASAVVYAISFLTSAVWVIASAIGWFAGWDTLPPLSVGVVLASVQAVCAYICVRIRNQYAID